MSHRQKADNGSVPKKVTKGGDQGWSSDRYQGACERNHTGEMQSVSKGSTDTR